MILQRARPFLFLSFFGANSRRSSWASKVPLLFCGPIGMFSPRCLFIGARDPRGRRGGRICNEQRRSAIEAGRGLNRQSETWGTDESEKQDTVKTL